MSEETVAAGSRGRSWPDSTLMSRLDERTGEELVSLVPGIRYRAGAVLISQGARDMRVYLLEPASSGSAACVKITACLENGQEALLGIGVSGDVVGEQAVLGQRARSATAVACSPLVAHPIPGRQFMEFLGRRPGAWHALALMITERLDWADRRRLSFAGYDVRVHLARVLVELVDRHGYLDAGGRALGVSLSQPELGRLIGAGQDATAIAIRQLRQAGLVKTRYRGLVVSDLPALRVAAGLK
jgi:CRP/FNR family transcriptional regulator, cyclic AMP receptor protein